MLDREKSIKVPYLNAHCACTPPGVGGDVGAGVGAREGAAAMEI